MCDRTAFFSVKEVELGIVADIGSLQRLPSVVGARKGDGARADREDGEKRRGRKDWVSFQTL